MQLPLIISALLSLLELFQFSYISSLINVLVYNPARCYGMYRLFSSYQYIRM
jgi:hypothetical protein